MIDLIEFQKLIFRKLKNRKTNSGDFALQFQYIDIRFYIKNKYRNKKRK